SEVGRGPPRRTGGSACASRRAGVAAGPPARLPDPALPPRSRRGRDRRHPRRVTELGEDPSAARPRLARAAIGGPSMSTLEDRLRDALQAGAEAVEPAPDLFARVQRSVAEDRRRRRWRTRIALISGAVLAVLAALVLLTTEHRNGEAHMDWWIFEVLVTAVLIAIAVILGPFIKR